MTSSRSKTDGGKSLELSVTTPILTCLSPLIVRNWYDGLALRRSPPPQLTLTGSSFAKNSRYACPKNIGANSCGDGDYKPQSSRDTSSRADYSNEERHDNGHQKAQNERADRGTDDRPTTDRAKALTKEINGAERAEGVRD